MRLLKSPAVYIHQRVLGDERSMRRMERMMTRIETPKIIEGISDEDLTALISEHGWTVSRRITGSRKLTDPPIVFNAFDFSQPTTLARQGTSNLFHGGGAWTMRNREHVRQHDGVVCQTAIELHSVRGCLFKCDYCYFENVLNIMLNLEELRDNLAPVVAAAPQRLWKYDNGSDILTFEPEYGASEVLVTWFGTQRRGFLMHYTKSDNVDVLRDLPHNGQTIVCWSLAAQTQSQVIEGDTADWLGRIEAARKCQEWGYPVRFRFSPVVPVRNWREENAALIDRLLTAVRPEVLSLLVLSRFPDFETLARTIDLDLLDPSFVNAAREAHDQFADKLVGPFPHHKRAEIYRFMIEEIRRRAPEVPLTICLETEEMWAEVGHLVNGTPAAYPCCCGPNSVRGSI